MTNRRATHQEITTASVTIPAATSATVDGAARIDIAPDVGDGSDIDLIVTRLAAQGIIPTDLTIVAAGSVHRSATIPLPPSLQAEVNIPGATSKGVTLTVRNRRQADVTLVIEYRGRAKVTTTTLATGTITVPLPDAGARPAFYDRDAVAASIAYSATAVAEHTGGTVRATYTVPAGKQAFIDGAVSWVRRRTTPAAAGLVQGSVGVFTAAGVFVTHLVFNAFVDATVNAARTVHQGSLGIAAPGQLVRITTGDASTTSSVDYEVSVKITEFTA